MGLAALMERRSNPRKKLTGLFPGKLMLKENRQFLEAKPVDISQSGLGILTSVTIEPETLLVLKTHNEEIVLKVAWRKKDFEKSDLFRYGLSVEGSTTDLEQIFSSSGCLK